MTTAQRSAPAPDRSVVAVYSPTPGTGGSGLLAHQVLCGLAREDFITHALGPRPPTEGGLRGVVWYEPPPTVPSWVARTWLRWRSGELVLRHSRSRGQWAARQLRRINPDRCYTFTEVGLECLRWARGHGIPTILDTPTGHIRHFRDAIQSESERWCGRPSPAHPTRAMVDRVEEEYALADRIRVGSSFGRDSLIARGVPAATIDLVPYGVDVGRFTPPVERRSGAGPLRVCFVGMLALHKGFVYLLRAARLLGPSTVTLRLVGGTVDRDTRRLLARERAGLDVVDGSVPDLLPEFHRADVLVLPTLHDGFGMVVGEAMAAGLPVIVSNQCGAADWVQPGETGWIVPAADESALAAALAEAMARRSELPDMGRSARAAACQRTGTAQGLRAWAYAER